jgi:hypothetical protein
MCTIGAVKNSRTGHRYLFKNVDQTDKFTFTPPRLITGSRYEYLKFPTGLSPHEPGVWGGVNSAGVAIVGADGNCLPNYCGEKYFSLNESLVIYEKALQQCGSAQETAFFVIEQYQRRRIGGNGDIVLIGDRNESTVLE